MTVAVAAPTDRVRRDAWPLAGLAAASAFLVLTVLVVTVGGLPFDVPLAEAIRGLPVPDAAWVAITSLGGGSVLVPVGVSMGLIAFVTRRFRLVVVIAVVLVGASLSTEVMKILIERPRPPGEHVIGASGFSFPSGHTVNSAASYGLLAVIAWRSRLPVAVRSLAVAAGMVLPFLVGLSRIALGVHYPSDVLGGWIGAIAFVAAGATAMVAWRAMAREGAPNP